MASSMLDLHGNLRLSFLSKLILSKIIAGVQLMVYVANEGFYVTRLFMLSICGLHNLLCHFRLLVLLVGV